MLLRRSTKQKGVAFIETAITLPVFILLLTGLIEITKLLNTHILAAHLAYEAVRLASKTPAFITYDVNGNPGVNTTVRSVLVEKVVVLAHAQNAQAMASNNVAYYLEPAPAYNPDAVNITVRVDVPYTPVFALFGKTSVSSSSTTEYSFEST